MTITENEKLKGHVEFKQTPGKLVAQRPEDEAIQENLEETMMNDGYPGSCGIRSSKKSE
jgi:hypothetical protein